MHYTHSATRSATHLLYWILFLGSMVSRSEESETSKDTSRFGGSARSEASQGVHVMDTQRGPAIIPSLRGGERVELKKAKGQDCTSPSSAGSLRSFELIGLPNYITLRRFALARFP